ncbi:hypothetical protein VPNG_02373 [Cytospora leucostoma]|uniref:Flavin reductase like domain-containing protein n=1 Tax=Cytospora leucostoma TaxID=1230097 RepID=A0A423XGP6_9PEZI|nr:hypothetical protein VPNG_02373 [Cytospora leucostoma]
MVPRVIAYLTWVIFAILGFDQGPVRSERTAFARHEVGGALHAQSRPFTTSPPFLQNGNNEDNKKEEQWRLAAHVPPSVHPHPHHDTTFDSLSRSEQLRTVMRLLPHSVVVCTSASTTITTSTTPTTSSDSDPESSPGSSSSASTSATAVVPRGMTMSSFTSLTLHPAPLVTFNIATPSRTLDAVSQARRFNVHVLSGDVAGGRVAEWFRRGNAEGLGVFDKDRMREGCGCEVIPADADVSGAGLTSVASPSPSPSPPLLRGPGVLYALRCRLLDDEPARGLVRVRDHVLVLAEVVDIVEGEGREGEEPFGLAYADRRYRQLGRTMIPG